MFHVIPGNPSILKIKDFSTNKSYSVQTLAMCAQNYFKAANCIVNKKILLCGGWISNIYYKTSQMIDINDLGNLKCVNVPDLSYARAW